MSAVEPREMRVLGQETITWFHPDDVPECMTVIVSGGIAYRKNGEWFSLTACAWPGLPIQWEVRAWTPLRKAPAPHPSPDRTHGDGR